MAEGQRDALVSIDKSLGPIMWHYLRDATFSRFDTIPECDRHTDLTADVAPLNELGTAREVRSEPV